MAWKICFWCWKIDGRKRDEKWIEECKDRRKMGKEIWSRPWPETVASHGRDFSDSRPWLETVGSHGRDSPKLTAVTHLQKRRIFMSARGVLGDLLRTFGGIFYHNSTRVSPHMRGYKYSFLTMFKGGWFWRKLSSRRTHLSLFLQEGEGRVWKEKEEHFKIWGFLYNST